MKRKISGLAQRGLLVLTILMGVMGLLVPSQPVVAEGPIWTRQFGTAQYDAAWHITVDSSGNSYVVGKTQGVMTLPIAQKGQGDVFVRKYNSAGIVLWTDQFGTAGDDEASSVAIDSSGNIYVVGSVEGSLPYQTSAGGTDAFVRKYTSTGIELWTRQFGSALYTYAKRVAFDSDDNIHIAGYTAGSLSGQIAIGGWDAFVRKYDEDGTVQSTRQFGSSEHDRVYSIAIDSSDNSYIVGTTEGTLPGKTSAGLSDAFIRKYNSAGAEVWTRQYGTSNHDYSIGVGVDNSGNVYVAGTTYFTLPGQLASGNGDAFVRKYNSNGSVMWTRQFGSVPKDYTSSIAVDSSGNSYVVGYTAGILLGEVNAGGEDAFVQKYDSNGIVQWTHQFGSTNNDGAMGVALSSVYVYVAGYTGGNLAGNNVGNNDAFVRKIAKSQGYVPLALRSSSSGW